MKTLLIALVSALTFTGCEWAMPDSCEEIIGVVSESCTPSKHQKIASLGGSLKDAIFIVDHSENFTANHYCNSACSFILINAKGNRALCENTYLGFHRARNAEDGSHSQRGDEIVLNITENNNRINFEYFKSMFLNTEIKRMTYISGETALQHGLIDEIIECDDWF